MKNNILGTNFYQVVSLEHKLIFLTPPKCGTYSLKKFLDNEGIKTDEPLKFLTTPFYHATLSEIVYSYDINLNDLKNYKIIQIVRNPYSRFISLFYHQQDLLELSIDLDFFINKIENFKYLLPYNVKEFELNFFRNEEFLINQSKLNQDGGTRFYYEQNWWNNLDLDISINYFKLENINQNLDLLCNLLDINLPKFPYPFENVNPFNKLELSPSIKNRIYNLYKNDFKLFNYSKYI